MPNNITGSRQTGTPRLMDGGFMKLPRSYFEGRNVRMDPLSRPEALVWLAMNAAHRPVTWDVSGKPITLQRGQWAGSVRYLADQFGWEPTRVVRWISSQQSRNTLMKDVRNTITLITVCHYNDYFGSDDRTATEPQHLDADQPQQNVRDKILSSGTSYPQSHGTAAAAPSGREMIEAEIVDDAETDLFGEVVPAVKSKPAKRAKRFQEFWDVYPHREGKKKERAAIEQIYARCIQNGTDEQSIIDGAVRYSRDKSVLFGRQFGPRRWLQGQCWNDETDPVTPTVVSGGHTDGTTSGQRPPSRNLAIELANRRLAAGRS